jgi:hypothetical protein
MIAVAHWLRVQRYFIHVCNGAGFVEDEEGQELPSREAAIQSALDSVRSIVSEDARQGLIDLTGRVLIADAEGVQVAEIGYSEAFELRLQGPSS